MQNKKHLADFFGVLDKESGEELENKILELRKIRNDSYSARMKSTIEQLNE